MLLAYWQLKLEVENFKCDTFKNSPTRGRDDKPPSGFDPIKMSLYFYKHHAKVAIQKLMEFVSAVLPVKKINVMYSICFNVVFWYMI